MYVLFMNVSVCSAMKNVMQPSGKSGTLHFNPFYDVSTDFRCTSDILY